MSHPVASGDFTAFQNASELSYLSNLKVRQSSVSNVTSFLHHVADIVSVRPEPKMRRINTIRAISTRAVMKRVHPIWDRPKVHHPRNPMRQLISVSVGPSANSPVSLGQVRSMKQPASIALDDTTPKAFVNGVRKSLSEKIREITVGVRHFDLSCIDRLIWLGVRGGDNHSYADFFFTRTPKGAQA